MKNIFFSILIACLCSGAAQAATQTGALERLKTYIEVVTIYPPGNESRGVEFFSRIFDAAGIAYEKAVPGKPPSLRISPEQ